MRDGFDEEELGETTIQILFFDGEEAFHDWSDTDSIYGARYVCVHELIHTTVDSLHQTPRRAVG